MYAKKERDNIQHTRQRQKKSFSRFGQSYYHKYECNSKKGNVLCPVPRKTPANDPETRQQSYKEENKGSTHCADAASTTLQQLSAVLPIMSISGACLAEMTCSSAKVWAGSRGAFTTESPNYPHFCSCHSIQQKRIAQLQCKEQHTSHCKQGWSRIKLRRACDIGSSNRHKCPIRI